MHRSQQFCKAKCHQYSNGLQRVGTYILLRRNSCTLRSRWLFSIPAADKPSAITSTITAVKEQRPKSAVHSTPREAGPGQVWYFAYGSNMSPDVLTVRRKVHPEQSVACVLDGYELSFRMRGLPYSEPGFATVLPSQSSSQPVHGVAHLITRAEWERIMATEGVGSKTYGYQVISVTCTAYGGAAIPAVTLQGSPSSLHSPTARVQPSKRYLGLLRQGAEHYKLHPSYVSYLQSLEHFDDTQPNAQLGKLGAVAVAASIGLPLLPAVLALRMARAQQEKQLGAGSGGREGVVAQQKNGRMLGAGGKSGEGQGGVGGQEAGSGLLPRAPEWVMSYMDFVGRATWGVHDVLLTPLLGDGRGKMKQEL